MPARSTRSLSKSGDVNGEMSALGRPRCPIAVGLLALLAILGGVEPLAADQLCTGYSGLPSSDGDKAGMIFILGGSFTMGSNRERPEERFTHIVQVDGFWIDQHEVTNAEFDKFVKATGYITLACRL